MLTQFSSRSWSRWTFEHFAFLAYLVVFSSSGYGDVLWVDIADLNDAKAAANKSEIRSLPSEGRPVVFDLDALRSSLQNVGKGSSTPTVITFPEPSGTSRNFVVKRSSVLPDSLAARFPNILAFEGFAQDDPTVTIRFEVDELGVSAQVLEPGARRKRSTSNERAGGSAAAAAAAAHAPGAAGPSGARPGWKSR